MHIRGGNMTWSLDDKTYHIAQGELPSGPVVAAAASIRRRTRLRDKHRLCAQSIIDSVFLFFFLALGLDRTERS